MTTHLSPGVLGRGGGRIGEKIDRYVRAWCTAGTFRSALARDRVALSRGEGRGGVWLDDAAGRASRLRRGVPTRQEAGT